MFARNKKLGCVFFVGSKGRSGEESANNQLVRLMTHDGDGNVASTVLSEPGGALVRASAEHGNAYPGDHAEN